MATNVPLSSRSPVHEAADRRDGGDLLARYAPYLRYDSQAPYLAVSAATMTDNRGNKLVRNRPLRNNEVLASARGVPPLRLSLLCESQVTQASDGRQLARYDAHKADSLTQASSRLADARRMQRDAQYADRVYGRRIPDDAPRFLQYWMWFYYEPLEILAGGRNLGSLQGREGAWRLAQVELDANFEPVQVVVQGFGWNLRPWTEVKLHPDDGTHPVLYVAPFTHNLFFEPGLIRTLTADRRARTWRVWDGSDGAGPAVLPAVSDLGGWEKWPGKWGGSPESPRSPTALPGWKDPAGVRGPALVRREILRRLNRRTSDVAAPEVDARLQSRRLVVRYGFKGKALPPRLCVTVHQERDVLAVLSVDDVRPAGEVMVELPFPVTTACAVRVSALMRDGARSQMQERTVRPTEPDQHESAIYESVVDAQLRNPEVQAFAETLEVDTDVLRNRLCPEAEGDEDHRAKIWRRVAEDLQKYRVARTVHGRAQAARQTIQHARLRFFVLSVTLVLLFAGAGLSFLLLSTYPTVGLGLGALPYLAVFLGYLMRSQWQRLRKARGVLRECGSAGSDEDAEIEAATVAFEDALRSVGVAPAIREALNEDAEDRYGETLDFGIEGLGGPGVREYELETDAIKRLRGLVGGMRHGSIGIAGPRGAGKTTLINAYCQPADTNDRRLRKVIEAPVRYEARDFILTLFGQLCEAVEDTEGDESELQEPQPGWWRRAVLFLAAAVAGTMAFTFFGLVLASKPPQVIGDLTQELLGFQRSDLITLILAFLAAGVSYWLVRIARRHSERREASPSVEQRLKDLAQRNLRDIRFQQSFSYGYSGKLSLPFAAEASVSAKEDLAQRQESFPEIVERFKLFLALAAEARDQVVIGIDEMDKMESGEVATNFLNEIKGIFAVDGCFYLVSVSESAMSSFERRGLPFRDVFDSSFDEIITVAPLQLSRSKMVLRSHVVGLGPAYLDLCHCLSGGLPRDLLRVLRELNFHNRKGDLQYVTKKLIKGELERKVEAATVSARGVPLEPNVSELLFWMRSLRASELTPDDLLQHGRSRPHNWPRDSVAGDTEECDELSLLQLEMAGFTYFLATVLEFFCVSPDREQEHFQDAEQSKNRASKIELLAGARGAFAVNPRVAIATIDQFRARSGWATIGFTQPPDGPPVERGGAPRSHDKQDPPTRSGRFTQQRETPSRSAHE